jgi:multidrug transporter EmrE-like cation transporter
MGRITALSIGSKLVLVAAAGLFLNLSLTWQEVPVDYGPAGEGEALLDGWDAWGLLIGLATIVLVTLVVILQMTEVEVSEDVPWDRIVLGLGVSVFVLTLAKNVLDQGSTVASYVGLGLAALVLLGCILDQRAAREPRRRMSSSASEL